MSSLLGATPPRSETFVSFDVPLWVWGAFLGGLVALLAADLFVVHRKPHQVSLKMAAVESAAWVALGLGFTVVLLWWQGGAAASEYLAGYLIEKSLSVDNVFVWAVIFTYFGVPPRYQFRALFWGIFGALVLRGIFIFAGVALLEAFSWLLYVFGAFLLLTAVKIVRHKGSEVHPEANPVLRLVRRIIPMTSSYDGQRFFTHLDGRRVATPLFAVLVLIEATDVVFAVDSVPAILAVSREEFIVFSSNAMAILGLRAMYFLLGGLAGRFRYLHVGLGVILAFVGVKMMLVEFFHVPTAVSLGVIAVVLGVTIAASIRADRRAGGRGPAHEAPAPAETRSSQDPEVSDPQSADPDAGSSYLRPDR